MGATLRSRALLSCVFQRGRKMTYTIRIKFLVLTPKRMAELPLPYREGFYQTITPWSRSILAARATGKG
jgi:hypothetical protein